MNSHEFAPFAGRRGFALLLSAWGMGKGVAVEIGTHRGEYAFDLLHNWAGTLYCIDPWSTPPGYEEQAKLLTLSGGNGNREADLAVAKKRLRPHIASGRCVLLRSVSIDAVLRFKNDAVDLVYIDGDHSAEGVRTDITLWWDKIHAGGILAGHDYVSTNEANGEPGRTIAREVDTFAASKGLTVFVVREPDDNPWSWYLVKPDRSTQ